MQHERDFSGAEGRGQRDVSAFGKYDVRLYFRDQFFRPVHGGNQPERHRDIAEHFAAFQPRAIRRVIDHVLFCREFALDALAPPEKMYLPEMPAQFGKQRHYGHYVAGGASARKYYAFHCLSP